MKEINRIMFFDDRFKFGEDVSIETRKNYLEGVLNVVKQNLDSIGKDEQWCVVEDVNIQFYTFKESEPCVFKLEKTVENQYNIQCEMCEWRANPNDLLELNLGANQYMLVFSDYNWENDNADIILEMFKSNPCVVFACYSNRVFDEAQEWLDMQRGDEFQCTVIKTLLALPNDVNDKLYSIKGAILDEW